MQHEIAGRIQVDGVLCGGDISCISRQGENPMVRYISLAGLGSGQAARFGAVGGCASGLPWTLFHKPSLGARNRCDIKAFQRSSIEVERELHVSRGGGRGPQSLSTRPEKPGCRRICVGMWVLVRWVLLG